MKKYLCSLNYRKWEMRAVDKRWLNAFGRVLCVGKGPGPRNVLVKIYGMGTVVVPWRVVRVYK